MQGDPYIDESERALIDYLIVSISHVADLALLQNIMKRSPLFRQDPKLGERFEASFNAGREGISKALKDISSRLKEFKGSAGEYSSKQELISRLTDKMLRIDDVAAGRCSPYDLIAEQIAALDEAEGVRS